VILSLLTELYTIVFSSSSFHFSIACSINAVTLLITAVILAENGEGNMSGRIEKIFDIMDFDGTNQITMDEMVRLMSVKINDFIFHIALCMYFILIPSFLFILQTILLFCTGSSMGSILDRARDVPSDSSFSKASLDSFEQLGKKANVHITKSEFISWAVRTINGATTLEAVFAIVIGGLETA
jgi:hypothetical protein